MNIKDIAKLSGVGVSTVSRVLNNHTDVKPSTREKVLAVIKESNYVPNNSARMLKQNNTNNIGVLVKGVFNPFFSEITNVIGNIINKSQYTMILEQNDYKTDDDFETLQAFIKEKKLQGVICLGGNFQKVSPESIKSLEVPVVLTSVSTDVDLETDGYSSVGINNVKAAYEATKYLVELGHKEIIVMIGEEDDLGISWNRLKGYEKALEEANITFDINKVLIGDYSAEVAYRVMREYLDNNNDITAVFAISDIMAVGVAKAIIEKGLEIGKDISLIGFDGMYISEFYNPSITTVRQPKTLIAEKSIEILLNLIGGQVEHQHVVLDTELIKRSSCNVLG